MRVLESRAFKVHKKSWLENEHQNKINEKENNALHAPITSDYLDHFGR